MVDIYMILLQVIPGLTEEEEVRGGEGVTGLHPVSTHCLLLSLKVSPSNRRICFCVIFTQLLFMFVPPPHTDQSHMVEAVALSPARPTHRCLSRMKRSWAPMMTSRKIPTTTAKVPRSDVRPCQPQFRPSTLSWKQHVWCLCCDPLNPPAPHSKSS